MSGDFLQSQSNVKPRIIPFAGDADWSQIDRAQSLDPDGSLTREKVEELGRKGIVAWIKDTSVVGCKLTQREYGEIDFFLQLANKAVGTTKVELDDFETTAFDICAYLTDSNDDALGTLWYPKQRLVGFSINIGDPTALIERSFDFTGEKAHIFQGNNKYLIFKKYTVDSGDLSSANSVDIAVASPSAVQDPLDSKYILRVVRVRGTTSTQLEETEYSYIAPTLTVEDCQAGDVIKYWYTSSAWVTSPVSPFVENDLDLGAIRANSVSLYLQSSNYLYKVQSATLDVKFDRQDIREVGNEEVIGRTAPNKTVTVTLGKLLDTAFTIEEILSGQSDGFGHIDMDEYSTDLTFVLAVYSDATKQTFKLGFKAPNLSPTTYRPGTAEVNTNVQSGITLEGEELTISTQVSDLGI